MKSRKIDIKQYSLLLILAIMLVICTFLSSSFLTATNLTNILKQVSVVTILAFAQGMIIITGEIDLSIGYLASMAGTFACIIFIGTGSLLLAFVCGIIIGAVIGALNGLFVAHFKLPSFIVTLAMQSVCLGIICKYTQGQNVYQIGNFKALGQTDIGGVIPITVLFMIIMLVLTAAVWFVLSRTYFGRYVYGVGGNAEAMKLAGINVDRPCFR